jgi:DNA ligase-1
VTPAPVPAAAGAPAGARHFEFVEGTSSKFWEVWVMGCRMTAKYGRIGSQGATTIKDFPTEEAANKAAEKKVAEKLREGYVEK